MLVALGFFFYFVFFQETSHSDDLYWIACGAVTFEINSAFIYCGKTYLPLAMKYTAKPQTVTQTRSRYRILFLKIFSTCLSDVKN